VNKKGYIFDCVKYDEVKYLIKKSEEEKMKSVGEI